MNSSYPLVFSVTSGKGGVGKTNISVNLALTLAARGKRVLLLDADLGLANVDVLLGLHPEKNIFHLFHEGASLRDILLPTEYGFSILPASSGVSEMLALNSGQKLELLDAMDELEDDLDFLIVDTGAGINDSVLYFNVAAQERLLVPGRKGADGHARGQVVRGQIPAKAGHEKVRHVSPLPLFPPCAGLCRKLGSV